MLFIKVVVLFWTLVYYNLFQYCYCSIQQSARRVHTLCELTRSNRSQCVCVCVTKIDGMKTMTKSFGTWIGSKSLNQITNSTRTINGMSCARFIEMFIFFLSPSLTLHSCFTHSIQCDSEVKKGDIFSDLYRAAHTHTQRYRGNSYYAYLAPLKLMSFRWRMCWICKWNS